MANQIVLAWTVDVTNTSLGPAGAATALGAVPLYDVTNPITDPVLGQNFGLTVASDVSAASGPTTATRTLTLNMTGAVGAPFAPPPFPCRPITSTPPVLPYPLREAVTLPGSFFPSSGATNVPTTMTQIPSLAIGSIIQFLSQEGVFYTVAAPITATSITLSTPYTGITKNTGAFKEIAAPVANTSAGATLAAIYSTSDFDTAPVATVPAIAAGSGARTVHVIYKDSLGAGPFTSTVSLTGKRPAAVVLAGGLDIAEIENIVIVTTGGFKNSVGQITLVELSSALPPIPANATPFDFLRLTDEAQLLIDRALVYLPPSYFALAQQGASEPQLAGDFIVTTGSTNVPTTVDQTAALAAGNVIRFADQQAMDHRQLPVDVLYTVAAVTPKYVTLARPYTGIDTTNVGTNNIGTNANAGTKGNIGAEVQGKSTGATLISPSPAAPPTNAQLSGPLGQFVDPGNAAPPPKPPLSPATMTPPVTVFPGAAPNFLSDLFTQTLQLALAGVPITPQPIAFV